MSSPGRLYSGSLIAAAPYRSSEPGNVYLYTDPAANVQPNTEALTPALTELLVRLSFKCKGWFPYAMHVIDIKMFAHMRIFHPLGVAELSLALWSSGFDYLLNKFNYAGTWSLATGSGIYAKYIGSSGTVYAGCGYWNLENPCFSSPSALLQLYHMFNGRLYSPTNKLPST